jgi:ABC-type nitrate/sulfonate/bicarbonate transport system substrate-binding protein
MLGRVDEVISLDNLTSLIGKRVGVAQLAEVPGLTLKAVLTKNGVPWQECREGVPVSENKVNLFALTGADAIDETSNLDYWMAGEPAVSARVAKGLYRVGDLQAWYGGGYTQAVLLAKTEVIESRSAWVQAFWSDLQASRDWVLQAEGATLVSVVTAHLEDKNGSTTLNAPLLTGVALAHCGIAFRSASESKEETQAFLRDILTVNQNATALPNDAFYYHGVAQE